MSEQWTCRCCGFPQAVGAGSLCEKCKANPTPKLTVEEGEQVPMSDALHHAMADTTDKRTPKLAAGERPAKYGTCCACGYEGDEETLCPNRKDKIHCVHWWDVELADE